MPAPQGNLWLYFFKGEKQNSSQHKAYCYGCIQKHRPPAAAIDLDDNEENLYLALRSADWFEGGKKKECPPHCTHPCSACLAASHVRGDKVAMVPHLLKCPNASKSARLLAKSLLKEKRKATEGTEGTDGDDEGDSQPQRKRRQVFENVKTFSQSQMKVYKGINIPFSTEESAAVQQQFLHATISANLPFMWTEDIEVIKLFLMFRATATNVMPAASSLAGRLLNSANEQVEAELRAALMGKYATLA